MRSNKVHNQEGGNAVTLTLLGLAVAILAGVVVLYYIGKSTPQPIPLPDRETVQEVEDESLLEDVDPREGWRSYMNESYDFSIQYPPGWIVATGTIFGEPVVTLYDATQDISTSSFGVHAANLRVTVYPHGIPTGGSGEPEVQSKTIITVPEATARDHVLGSGKSWGTLVRFEQYPESWTESGYLFGRVTIEEEEIGYFRDDVGISPEEFDVYAGDEMKRFGFVNTKEWELVSEILKSFSFVRSIEEEEDEGNAVSDLIQVTAPSPDDVITSPVVVEGQARGQWYFEGDFPVQLVTADGQVLAEVPATAQDEWMTEEYVPFEVSLVFGTTTATSGTLVLHKSNPSGLPELSAELSIPVHFTE